MTISEYTIDAHADEHGTFLWYRKTLAPGLVVAFLVAVRDGDFFPVEVRVYPGRPTDSISEHPSTLEVTALSASMAPLMTEHIRAVNLKTALAELRQEMRADELGQNETRDPDGVLGAYVSVGLTAAAILKATIPTRRRQHSTNELLAVAFLYDRAIKEGRSVHKFVHEQLAHAGRRYALKTIPNLINKTCAVGLLTKTTAPGKARRELTGEAVRLIRLIDGGSTEKSIIEPQS